MRTFRFVIRPALVAVALLFAGTACSGSGGGILGPIGPGGGFFACNPGTQVQLADPVQNQSVSSAYGHVTIVANGNNNTLYDTYQQWQLNLQDDYNDFIPGGQLSLVPYPSGPHPYASDFYYQSSIPNLPVGRTWSVTLTLPNQSCSAAYVGSFST